MEWKRLSRVEPPHGSDLHESLGFLVAVEKQYLLSGKNEAVQPFLDVHN